MGARTVNEYASLVDERGEYVALRMSGRHGGVARCDMQAEPLVRRYTWVAVRHARRRACYASGWAFAGTGAPRRILMHRLLLASGLAGLAATGTDGGRGAG